MPQIFETFTCDIRKPLKVQVMHGDLFYLDNGANQIRVSVRKNGEPYEITGNVVGSVLREDGYTVGPITGAVDGTNVAYISLPSRAYTVVGRVIITIKLITGNQVTTIACIVAYVHRTEMDGTVDPGPVISDIDALISAINTAVGSIPVDYSQLVDSVADMGTIPVTNWTAGYLTDNGVIAAQTAAVEKTTDYIKVYPGQKLWFQVQSTAAKAQWLRVAEYNEYKAFLRRDASVFPSASTAGAIASQTVGADAYYIRVSYSSHDATTPTVLRIFYDLHSLDAITRNVYATNVWCGTTGNRPEIALASVFEGLSSGTLTVFVPNRIQMLGIDGFDTVPVDFSGESVYTLAHNDLLYYDFDAGRLVQESYATYAAKTHGKHTVLVMCSYGKPFGQWARYARTPVNGIFAPQSFTTCELVNRQGEIQFNRSTGTTKWTPENSLIGCAVARKLGFNRIRISIEMTKDGYPVAFHDYGLGGNYGANEGSNGKVYVNGVRVTRKSANDVKINTLNYVGQLDNTGSTQYDFGAYGGSAFAGTRVATLREHLRQAKRMGYALDLEIKENNTPLVIEGNRNDFAYIHGLIVEYGMQDHVCIGAYQLSTLNYFKQRYPRYDLCYEHSALSEAEIDNAASLYDSTVDNRVYMFFGSEYFDDPTSASYAYTTALRAYATAHHVRLECGTDSISQDMGHYVEKLDKVECAWMINPVQRLIQ